jgi:hypothetical protein
MTRKIIGFTVIILSLFLIIGCSGDSEEVMVLKTYPLDKIDGVISRDDVEIDAEVSSDGKGSLKITAKGERVVELYETGDIDIEEATLIYRAKIKTEALEGQAYLQMWAIFTGKGDFFSKGLPYAKTGTNDWSTAETSFFLQEGQNPDNIKLQLVITGEGTVWIDSIELIRAPLQK